jgi:hypothetical protein
MNSAERQKKWREKHGIVKTVTVHLNQEQADVIAKCLEAMQWEGSSMEFYAAALCQGAKFRANAGNNKKVK